jgi:V/A-type H+-transporting ATPase subunit K
MKRTLLLMCVMLIGAAAFAQDNASGESTESLAVSIKYLAAAIAVGLSCIAGGIAVARVGAAALGAMSENPDMSGKALTYVGLAEGICLWGFLLALLILFI